MPEYRDSRIRSEGANQILDYCRQIAVEMSANLKNVYWVSSPRSRSPCTKSRSTEAADQLSNHHLRVSWKLSSSNAPTTGP